MYSQYLSDKANCRLGGGAGRDQQTLENVGSPERENYVYVPRHQPTKIRAPRSIECTPLSLRSEGLGERF